MCKADRVLLGTDGSVKSLEEGLADMALEVAQMNQKTTTPTTTTTNDQQPQQQPDAEAPPEKVYLGPEHSDMDVMKDTIHRLQIQTNLFYVDQLEKLMQQLGKKKAVAKQPAGKKKANVAAVKKQVAAKKGPAKATPAPKPTTTTTPTTAAPNKSTETVAEATPNEIPPTPTTPANSPATPTTPQEPITIPKPNVCLFIQTENPVSEYRHVIRDATGPKLNRGLVCYFMTEKELLTEVVPNHPHPGLKAKNFKTEFQKLVQQNNPMEGVVTVALFGADKIFLGASSLPPYDTMISQLEENNQFKNSDCLEIYIDQ